MIIETHSYNETYNFAVEFSKKLKKGDFIALYGDLGAGKTCFVSGLAKGLGSKDDVSSPTFAIVHYYRGNINLAHFDMYRINSDMLEDTGFFEYMEDGSVIACEWCENIENDIPQNAITVTINYGQEENTRIISVEGV